MKILFFCFVKNNFFLLLCLNNFYLFFSNKKLKNKKMVDKSTNSISYIGIINNKNEPIFLKNFTNNPSAELNFQLNIYGALDQIEALIKRKLSSENSKS